MQLELLEKIDEFLSKIDEFANIEERYYLKDLILNNLQDENLLIMSQELVDKFEAEDEDKERLLDLVKTLQEEVNKF